MEAHTRHRGPLPSDNVVKPVADSRSPAGMGDRFLVLKQQQQTRQRRSVDTNDASSNRPAHPWGPDAQGLQEVATQAGDTATMGSSTWMGDAKNMNMKRNRFTPDNSKSKAEKMLASRSSERSSLLSRALRLDQEEEHDGFQSVIVRRGIETARRKLRTAPHHHWKTPYEVDAPRHIMLPRDHPQESSSSGNASLDGSLSIEQQIWRGIEQLMLDAFSSDDSSETSTINPLPTALVRAISNRSVASFDSSYRSQGKAEFGTPPISEDDIEMAQHALNTFMDILSTPGDDDCSLPTLASWRGSIDGSTHDFDQLNTSASLGISDHTNASDHLALRNFMNALLNEVETSHKPAALSLMDLFTWTMRVNVDANEKQRFLGNDDSNNERSKNEVEEVVNREDRRQVQIAEDLRRHQELLLQKEAEEAELVRLEEEGNRLEEMLRLTVEEAARLRQNAENREESVCGQGEVDMEEYMKPLNDASPTELLSSTPAGRRRAEAKRRQSTLEQHETGSLDDTPRSVNPRPSASDEMLLSSIPSLATLESDTQTATSCSSKSHDTLEPLMSSKPSDPFWASDDDASIDPLKLSNRGARGTSTSIANFNNRQVYSSTEIRNRASVIAVDRSSGTISTLSAKSMPMLMPSESRRTLKAASVYESSDFSIDPTTLPNLSNIRSSRVESESGEKQIASENQGPQWAAIGGRQIMMPTYEHGLSSTNTNVSPDSLESGVLPSSFHSKNKLSSSGSVSTPSTRTLHVIPSNRDLMQHVETGSVRTSQDMPELKSLGDSSFGDSSGDGEANGIDHHSPLPKLFSSKYTSRGAKAMATTNAVKKVEPNVIFKRSIIEKGQSVFSSSFVEKMESAAVLPSSFVASAARDQVVLVQHQEIIPNATGALDFETLMAPLPADTTGVVVGDGKKKKEKKKGKKKKDKKKEKKLENSLVGTSSQRNLVISAMGDVFLDDVRAYSLHNLPDGHFDSQIFHSEKSQNSSTEVRSFGSAGDIHLGSAIVEMSDRDEEESITSDVSIDVELQLDELFVDGRRKSVPVTKDAWRRRQRRRQPISNNLLTRVKKFCWPLSRRKQADKETSGIDLDLCNSNGNLCLLHEMDTPYDRTPVLR